MICSPEPYYEGFPEFVFSLIKVCTTSQKKELLKFMFGRVPGQIQMTANK